MTAQPTSARAIPSSIPLAFKLGLVAERGAIYHKCPNSRCCLRHVLRPPALLEPTLSPSPNTGDAKALTTSARAQWQHKQKGAPAVLHMVVKPMGARGDGFIPVLCLIDR